jgi:hypothetical protein
VRKLDMRKPAAANMRAVFNADALEHAEAKLDALVDPYNLLELSKVQGQLNFRLCLGAGFNNAVVAARAAPTKKQVPEWNLF